MVIGQLVHYVARGSADGVFPSVCRAAYITEIIKRETERSAVASLAVLNPTGLFFDQNLGYNDDFNTPGTWHEVDDCEYWEPETLEDDDVDWKKIP